MLLVRTVRCGHAIHRNLVVTERLVELLQVVGAVLADRGTVAYETVCWESN